MTSLRLTAAAALIAAFTATAGAVSPQAPETPGANQGDRTTEQSGRAMQGSRVGADQTPGWDMMTTTERQQFQRDLQAAKTPDQCRQVMGKHRQMMQDRAKERGVPAPTEAKRDLCAGMSPHKPVP
jgi:hypothetical protein